MISYFFPRTDRQTERQTFRLIEAPCWSLKIKNNQRIKEKSRRKSEGSPLSLAGGLFLSLPQPPLNVSILTIISTLHHKRRALVLSDEVAARVAASSSKNIYFKLVNYMTRMLASVHRYPCPAFFQVPSVKY